jgi:hypothetical protein
MTEPRGDDAVRDEERTGSEETAFSRVAAEVVVEK